MWIRIDCPNGHPVKVEEKYAGRMGRCPACGAKVRIPQPDQGDLSEEAILDILGPSVPPAPQPLPVHAEPVATEAKAAAGSVIMGGSKIMGGSRIIGSPAIDQPTRICPACKRKVSIRYQICPHCRTYMPITDAGPGGAAPRVISHSCPHCGVTSFPGATVCGNCGESLT
jgi:hypothetical protein